MSSSLALKLDELVKVYGDNRAVDNLSFSVEQGIIFGLLGPNGAGKTTTLECIEGLRQRDGGKISLLGIDPASHDGSLSRAVGVQLQTSGIPGIMTPREAMQFFCRYHKVKPDLTLLNRLGLEAKKDVSYESLSVGQKRRLSLAVAAAHGPQVLILDEPTAGLDVESRAELHNLIREMKAEGKTVILATHDMAEAEKLCDKIAIIIGGKLAVMGTPSQITAAGDKRTKISVCTAYQSVVKQKPALQGAEPDEFKGEYACYISNDPAESVMSLLRFIEKEGDELIDLRVERPSLEQRFIEITKKKGDAA